MVVSPYVDKDSGRGVTEDMQRVATTWMWTTRVTRLDRRTASRLTVAGYGLVPTATSLGYAGHTLVHTSLCSTCAVRAASPCGRS